MQTQKTNITDIQKFLFLWVLTVTVILSACSSQPGKPGVLTGRLQYSIVDYGAVGDGETLNTNAIKAGTETTGGFKNISISNCVIRPSRYTEHRIYQGPATGLTGIALLIVDGGIRERKHIEGAPEPPVGEIKNISISNIVAHSSRNWTSSVEGMAGYPIKDISFNNVQFFTQGGVTRGDYGIDIKEDDKAYPERDLPLMPASGLYLRHVDGISIDNMVIGAEEKDVRVPIWVEDVNNLLVGDCRLPGGINSDVFVRGVGLTNYMIDKPLGWTGRENHVKLK